MTHGRTVVGVDVGTTTAKAVVLDEDGDVVGQASGPLQVRRGHDGVVEQDMLDVWRTAARAIATALAAAGRPRVAAVGIAGQGDGAWFVDGDLRPLGPAATWADGRADAIVERWRRDGRADLVERASGSALFPGCLLPLAAWDEEHGGVAASRARWQLYCKDWVRYRLTGMVGTDPTDASRTAYPTSAWDGAGPLEYDVGLLRDLDLEWLARLLPPITASSAVAGEVTASAAADTGLSAGTPVVTGLLDGAAAPLGLGVGAAGDGFALVGTTASYGVVSASMRQPPFAAGFCVPRGVGPGWYASLAPASGAPTLEWARSLLAPGSTWREFEDLARSAPEGARGALLLPHLSTGGERAPFVDPLARGGYVGVSLETGRADLARAAYEGLALTMADCLAQLPPVRRIALGGGGASSGLLAQVIADVTQTPVHVPPTTEPGAVGVARAAATAVGLERPLDAVAAPVVVEPRTGVAATYAAALDAHRAAVAGARIAWQQLARLRGVRR